MIQLETNKQGKEITVYCSQRSKVFVSLNFEVRRSNAK